MRPLAATYGLMIAIPAASLLGLGVRAEVTTSLLSSGTLILAGCLMLAQVYPPPTNSGTIADVLRLARDYVSHPVAKWAGLAAIYKFVADYANDAPLHDLQVADDTLGFVAITVACVAAFCAARSSAMMVLASWLR